MSNPEPSSPRPAAMPARSRVFPRFSGLTAGWVALLLAGGLAVAAPQAPFAPPPERQAALVHLVRQDCGSCHGMTLQGGLGPGLSPADLADKPAEGLIATIYHGRPGSPMPPWRQFISEAEAAWIVDQLQRGFPK